MKIFLVLLLACAPATSGAAGAGPYRDLVRELVKNAAGADKKIGVANFTYPDGRVSGDGDVVSGRITTELVRLKKFKVTERKEIEKVFAELKLQSSGAIGADSIKDIGKTLGADWLILGTLTELPGRRIEVNARLVGVESGEIISACAVKVKKDWSDKPAASGKGGSEFKDGAELEEYDKAIRSYMDKKAGEEKHVIKEPPPSF